MVSGKVRVTTVDENQQEVVVDEPVPGEFFGFASMLEQTPHYTNAIALEPTTELSRLHSSILRFSRINLRKQPQAVLQPQSKC
jgi:CRP-like cAMP-binding protein